MACREQIEHVDIGGKLTRELRSSRRQPVSDQAGFGRAIDHKRGCSLHRLPIALEIDHAEQGQAGFIG